MTAKIDTREYVTSHGKAPRGTGLWLFEVAGQQPPAECRARYGDAHDAHMATNDECPWCGAGRFSFNGSFSQARRALALRAPVTWVVLP
jgi:hypothetical protein